MDEMVTDSQRMCDHLLVGVSGSIHVLEIHRYLMRLKEVFAKNIAVMMTRSAEELLGGRVLRIFADAGVFTSAWDQRGAVTVPHIQLTQWADMFVVLPASANILGKAAHGIGDDLLSTAIIASPKPVVFAPAMNGVMWENAAVRRNVALLEQDRHYIIPPTEPGVEVATGERDAHAQSPDHVLAHLRHVYLRRLRDEYWQDATREPPRTPSDVSKERSETKRLAAAERAAERAARKEALAAVSSAGS